jgi:hypothetical protein
MDVIQKLMELRQEEVVFLAGLAKRAFQFTTKDEGTQCLSILRPILDRPKKVHVATISVHMPYLNQEHFKNSPHELADYLGTTGYSSLEMPASEKQSCQSVLRLADEYLYSCKVRGRHVDFLVINELAMAFQDREENIPGWQGICRKFGTYIVPGTFYKDHFGVAPFLGPHDDGKFKAVKQSTAIKQGESLRTPDIKRIKVFETEHAKVALLVCLDLYDPALVLKFLGMTNRFSRSRRKASAVDSELDLVLVPSCNGDTAENIQHAVSSLSRFAKTVFVCANAWPLEKEDETVAEKKDETVAEENHGRLESFVYLAGRPVPDIESFRDERPGHVARLYEIDMVALHEAQAENAQSPGAYSSVFNAIVEGNHNYTLINP